MAFLATVHAAMTAFAAIAPPFPAGLVGLAPMCASPHRFAAARFSSAPRMDELLEDDKSTMSASSSGEGGTTSEAGKGHRAGFVSILGVPNVGKSTLMNCILGERLSIATSKAQTTRHRIMGIDNGEDYQIVYSDTPGMLRPQYKLQEGMMSFVRSSVVDADVVLLVVDIFQTDIEEAFPDEKILRALRGTPAALLILVNKVDLLDENPPPEPWGLNLGGASGSSTQQEEKQQQQQQQQQQLSPEREARRAEAAARRRAELGTLDEILQRWRDEFPGSTVLPISAARGRGVQDVHKAVRALLPEHPPFYDKEQLTDKPERFFAGEFLREAIFEQYEQEVPYSCECRVDSFKETDDIIRIRAMIYVSHESQKGIVIGKKGAALKKVGIRARTRLEDFFQKQVYLETRVKVRPNWRSDLKALEDFGYV